MFQKFLCVVCVETGVLSNKGFDFSSFESWKGFEVDPQRLYDTVLRLLTLTGLVNHHNLFGEGTCSFGNACFLLWQSSIFDELPRFKLDVVRVLIELSRSYGTLSVSRAGRPFGVFLVSFARCQACAFHDAVAVD